MVLRPIQSLAECRAQSWVLEKPFSKERVSVVTGEPPRQVTESEFQGRTLEF